MDRLGWKILFWFVVILSMGDVTARAQFYSLGNDPSRAGWNSISSENFTIIYPRETDSLARLYLTRLEFHRPQVFESVGVKGKRIPVILHPYTILSNGAVTWAPKRIDLFTSPDAYGGMPDSWISQLTTHELRHQAQMEQFTQGVFKVLYYPLGESISGIGAGAYLGRCYMEGDAVISETELLKGGRGRNAEFLRYYRMAAISGDARNYYRYHYGSYHHYTPDLYAVGYQLATSLRRKSGDYFVTGKFQKARVDHWIDFRYIFSPYRKLTGYTKREHWDRSWEDMKSFWTEDMEKRGPLTEVSLLAGRKRRLYSEYLSPVPVTDSSSKWFGQIIAIRNGLDESPVLISIDGDGKESVICPFCFVSSDLELSPLGRLYWTERRTAGASTLEDFSVLKYLDLRTGTVWTYPDRRTKWFNPSVSAAGKYVTVTEYPVGKPSCAVLIDSRSDEIISRIEAPEKAQIKETAYLGNDMYATVITERGLGIYRYGEEGWCEIIAPQHQSVSRLRSTDSLLYFCSDLDGVQNIYALNPSGKRLTRITNSRYGADYPYLSEDGSLICSDFGVKGFRPVRIQKDSLSSLRCSFDAPFEYPIAEMLVEQRKSQSHLCPDSISVPDFSDVSRYPARRYSKLANLFRFHSWAPVYYDIDEILSMTYDNFYHLASLGAVAYSQNLLGNFVARVGYSAHSDDVPGSENGKRWFHSGHAKFTLKSIPYIEASLDFNDRYRIHSDGIDIFREGYYYNDKTRYYISDTYPLYVRTNVMLYYPLSFNGEGWNRSLIPQLNWSFSNDEYVARDGSCFFRNQLVGGISYSQTRPMAQSQLFPRWGFSLSGRYSSAPWGGSSFGHLGYIRGFAYLPGFTRNQGLKLAFTWQKQHVSDGEYLLTSQASMPKGYIYSSPTLNYRKFETAYAIPVYLGDIHIGWNVGLYLQRLELIPFYECAWDTGRSGVTRFFSSFGGDFLLDFKLTPINSPMSAGVRYSHIGEDCYWTTSGLKEGGRNRFQLLFVIYF